MSGAVQARRKVESFGSHGGVKESSISRVLGLLRDDIIEVELDPGSKLPISLLAERYEVSPGAIREALSRLVAEGLVTAEDQRGFRVSPISADVLRDIMATRVLVECRALALAIERGDANWEAEVLAATHRLERCPQFDDGTISAQWRELHRLYHLKLIEGSGSPTLLKIQQSLCAQTERYRCLRAKVSGKAPVPDRRDVAAEHRRITEASLSRDAATACAELERHFNLTVTMLEASRAL
jgi:DNA-binding GntR family transcriptional regulator